MDETARPASKGIERELHTFANGSLATTASLPGVMSISVQIDDEAPLDVIPLTESEFDAIHADLATEGAKFATIEDKELTLNDSEIEVE